jgi:hypothetical protein
MDATTVQHQQRRPQQQFFAEIRFAIFTLKVTKFKLKIVLSIGALDQPSFVLHYSPNLETKTMTRIYMCILAPVFIPIVNSQIARNLTARIGNYI